MSGEELGNLFRDGLVNGLLTGLNLFLNNGGWWLIGLAAIGFFLGLAERKRRRRY
jgi:tRNA A-37 threonylcarbamoyl transferase component Bud32